MQAGTGTRGRGWVVGVVVGLLALALAVVGPGAQSARAATTFTFTVDRCTDSGVTQAGIGGGTSGDLRFAVAQANAPHGSASDLNMIVFAQDCTGANAIMLAVALGPLTLSSTLATTIDGTGHSMVIDGHCTTDMNGNCTGGGTQVFVVNASVTAHLTALTIQHGDAGSGQGGGILNSGSLSLTTVALRHNRAGSSGGGLCQNAGSLALSHVIIDGNQGSFGGGMSIRSGTSTGSDVTISNNKSSGGGGGVETIFGATTTLTDVTLNNNTAGSTGGGWYIPTNSAVSLTNATVSGNVSPDFGGGGGFRVENSGTLTLINATVTGNSAVQDSGGISVVNTATLNATRSIIAGNTNGDVGGLGINGTNTNNLTGVNPLLAPLGNYGGTTQTQPPLPGSPAIDAGGAGCSATDQRGVMRPVGTACDIGAVESQGFSFSTQTGTPQTTAKNTAFPTPLGLTVTSSHGEPVVGGTVTFTGPGTGAGITGSPVVATITGPAGATSGTVSQSVTANATPGPFTVTASTAGVPTAGDLSYALAISTGITSITHTAPASLLTNAASVTYTVTFGDAVSGLTAGDFAVALSGSVTGASVGTVTPMGIAPATTWSVTVNTGTGDGTLRLDFTGTASDLSAPVSNAPFRMGDTYTIDKTAPTVASTPTTLPAATVGQVYGPVTFTATDAHMPQITGAMGLPPGWTFTPGSGMAANTATLSGTPTSMAAIMFTVQAQDAVGNTGSVPFTISVGKATSAVSVGAMPASVPQGVSVTLSATVTGTMGNPTPTGSVVFTSGSTLLGMGTLDGTGKASVTASTTALAVGMDPITASYGGDTTYATSVGMGSVTVTAAQVRSLDTRAPTGSGSGNQGTANMPQLAPGGSLTLSVTGGYTNGTTGSVSGLTYMSSDPTKVSVDASGKITALAPGTATITVTAPNGVQTTIVIVVTSVPTGGLTNPNMQPMSHATVAAATGTPVPQPGAHPAGGSGVQPQAAGAPTATPGAQPMRH